MNTTIETSPLDMVKLNLQLLRIIESLEQIKQQLHITQDTQEYTFIKQTTLFASHPVLTNRILQTIRKQYAIGRKVGRDILYTHEEVALIWKYLQNGCT